LDIVLGVSDRMRDESDVLAAVADVLRGESRSFGVVVARYHALLYGLSLSYLGSPEDAEDATQEVLLKVYGALPRFRLDKRFLPWLYTIAINHLRSRQKRVLGLRARRAGDDPDTLPAPPGPDVAAEDTKERVRRAVRSLPANLREVTTLYYLEGLDTAEVAEVLGLGLENVKSRLHRARARLRGLLAGDAPAGAT
jgi:RNA polymerase sigma-70 factor, ECF subfamily